MANAERTTRVQPLTSILPPPSGEANNGAARFDLPNWGSPRLFRRGEGEGEELGNGERMANVEIMTKAMPGRMLYPVRGHLRAFKSGDMSPQSKFRVSPTRCVAIVLVLLAITPLPIFGAGKNRAAMPLPGYKAVPVHY
jgi:hypothetical protein